MNFTLQKIWWKYLPWHILETSLTLSSDWRNSHLLLFIEHQLKYFFKPTETIFILQPSTAAHAYEAGVSLWHQSENQQLCQSVLWNQAVTPSNSYSHLHAATVSAKLIETSGETTQLNLKHFFIISVQIICERVSQGQLHPRVLFLCSAHGTDITKGSCLHGASPATSTRGGSFHKFQHTGHSKKINCNTYLCTSTGVFALSLGVLFFWLFLTAHYNWDVSIQME